MSTALASLSSRNVRSTLRVGLIGGPSRSGWQLERTAAELGCELEHHSGATRGRGTIALAAMIRRVDVLVILTDVNSHNAVVQARRTATACGRPYVLARRLGASQLTALLTSLRAGEVPS
jgi:hypothetical protein